MINDLGVRIYTMLKITSQNFNFINKKSQIFEIMVLSVLGVLGVILGSSYHNNILLY